MLSEPRAIFFQTELIWLPPDVSGYRLDKMIVRRFYNTLFEPEFNEHCYENLDLQAQKPTLSSEQAGKRSICRFSENSITIEEQRPVFAVDEFCKIVDNVVKAFQKALGNDGAVPQFPPVVSQRCRMQCLPQPHEVGGSLTLLAEKLSHVKDAIEPFERPPSFFGVRFRFGPALIATENGAITEHEGFVTVRFETYSNDPSQVWMEVLAQYVPLVQENAPATLESVALFQANIQNAYEFLTEKCKAFLDQYDKPQEKPPEDKPSLET